MGLLDMGSFSALAGPGVDWRECLAAEQDEEVVSRLRTGIRRGRPLGSDAFIGKLEAALGRRLRPRPVSRPRKPPDATKKGQ